MTRLVIASHKTPIGALQVVADLAGPKPVVLSSGWLTPAETIARLSLVSTDHVESVNRIDQVSDAIGDYFDGNTSALVRVATEQPGGPFMQDAWRALSSVKANSIVSYSDLAASAGRPKAVRAAASACARNLVAPFVPCHRVVRTDGSLGGYYYGLDKKIWLLNHEGHKEFSA